MTPSELKYNVELNDPQSFFFTRQTMRFFGDTMSNYGVRSAVIVSDYDVEARYIKEGVTNEYEFYQSGERV